MSGPSPAMTDPQGFLGWFGSREHVLSLGLRSDSLLGTAVGVGNIRPG